MKYLNKYRPVAIVSFLGKTIERACASQIQDYLANNDLRGKMQSACKPCYSTETALLRVYNDLLLAVDRGDEAVHILLDYSAAFDMVLLAQHLIRLLHISKIALNLL